MSNETPETAGTGGDSANRKPGTPVPDDADVTDSAEHPIVEQPAAEPLGASSHVGRAGGPVPDASEPVTLVEPEQRERAEYVGTPNEPVDQPVIEPADEPVTEAPHEPIAVTTAGATEAEPVAATSNAGAADVAASTPAEPAVQTVYVHAPVPPKRRGNRAFGSLLALAATVVFAAVYAGIALVVMPLFTPEGSTGFDFLVFVGLPVFYVPVLVFLVAFVLLVLIVNRANWWAYVLGSFIIALLVYFVSIGILLLLDNVIGMTSSKALQAFAITALSPLIIAAIVAREVPIWFGAAIAARGRRQKQRNAEEKAAFETELENNRSDFTRSNYGTN